VEVCEVLKEKLFLIIQNMMELKNNALLTGDLSSLEKLYQLNDSRSKKAFEKEKQNLKARIRSATERKIKFHRQTTKVSLGRESRTKDLIRVSVMETVTWWYYQLGKLQYERQQNYHKLTIFHDGNWLIKDDHYRLEPKIATIPRPFTHPLNSFNNWKILRTKIIKGNNYNREAAVTYAHKWWNGFNPNFRFFSVDCTNYVSQILYAGGFPIFYTGKQNSGWWYLGNGGQDDKWSFSWSVAHSLRWYLDSKNNLQVELIKTPNELLPGDIISYDWDGDGVWQHNTVVVGHNIYGQPLVNAHTTNSQYRYWDYKDSPVWNEKTRYLFWKIL
jgi:hypothetical protein